MSLLTVALALVRVAHADPVDLPVWTAPDAFRWERRAHASLVASEISLGVAGVGASVWLINGAVCEARGGCFESTGPILAGGFLMFAGGGSALISTAFGFGWEGALVRARGLRVAPTGVVVTLAGVALTGAGFLVSTRSMWVDATGPIVLATGMLATTGGFALQRHLDRANAGALQISVAPGAFMASGTF